ncbi:MAG TPA: HAD-IA family hydrolase, partial [candidate division Zixibacteria bacterium]|nr:HAD-IA family hydrolase [candidate division Zixibacteria bacterium]
SDAEILELHAELEPRAQAGAYKKYREILGEVVAGFGERYEFEATSEERAALAESIADWPPFSDCAEALQKLHERYLLTVISNIDNDLIRLSAARLGVDFDYIVTAEQVRAYKPDLRVFRHAYQRMDVQPSQALHCAQSLFHDIAPARELRIKNVWVNRREGQDGWGATPPSEAAPDFEVASLAELAELLLAD